MEESQAAVGISPFCNRQSPLFELKLDVRSNRTGSGKALEKCQELMKIMPCFKKMRVASQLAIFYLVHGQSHHIIELVLSIYPMSKKRST